MAPRGNSSKPPIHSATAYNVNTSAGRARGPRCSHLRAVEVMGRVGMGAHFPRTYKHPTRLFMGNGRSRNGRPAGAGTMVTYFPLRFPSDPAQTWDPFLPLTPWFGGASVEAGGKTLHPSRSQTAAAGKGRRKRELWGRQSAQESPGSLAACVMVGCQAHAGQTLG